MPMSYWVLISLLILQGLKGSKQDFDVANFRNFFKNFKRVCAETLYGITDLKVWPQRTSIPNVSLYVKVDFFFSSFQERKWELNQVLYFSTEILKCVKLLYGGALGQRRKFISFSIACCYIGTEDSSLKHKKSHTLFLMDLNRFKKGIQP